MIKTMLGKQLLDTVNTTITYKERFEEFDLTKDHRRRGADHHRSDQYDRL